MKEIKFRVWDEKQKLMMGCFNLPLITEFESQELRKNYSNIILMQFIGLHDKNGKEIFEGDITQETYDFGDTGIHKSRVQEVFWNSESCQFALCPSTPYGYSDIYFSDKREVIGNIYENPELLTPAGSSSETVQTSGGDD